MRPPLPLLRQDHKAHKNKFGHVLVLAGSPSMLGAAALTALAAMRAGAGLVTCGIPRSLNLTLQKKISPVVMTMPLPETKSQTLALGAWAPLAKILNKFDAIAIGPGLSQSPQTQKFILKCIAQCPKPLIIDADALNALSTDIAILNKNEVVKVLTPHHGEMAKLLGQSRQDVEKNPEIAARYLTQYHGAIIVLKGHPTLIACGHGKVYKNQTGNAGMATAGSGDVLTGMIAALIAQGTAPLEAARFGVYWHGKAGDLAARHKTKAAMIATDIIDYIPSSLRSRSHHL